MPFLYIQLLNELSYPFHLTYSLLSFSFITFLILNSFWCFLQLFFVKSYNSFFSANITNNSTVLLIFLNLKKNLKTNLEKLPFAKISLDLDIHTWSPTLHLGSSFFNFSLKSMCMLRFTPTGLIFIFNCSVICIVVLINYVV